MNKDERRSDKQYRWMLWLMHQFQEKRKFSGGRVIDPWNWMPAEVWNGFDLQASKDRKDQLGNDPTLDNWRCGNFMRSFLTRVGKDDIGEPPTH